VTVRRLLALPMLALLGGCANSGDPAEGGFVAGVAGVAGGGYQSRIDERQAGVAAAEARGAELDAELALLNQQHRALQARLTAQRALLAQAGVPVTPEMQSRVDQALRPSPSAGDPAARAASLRQAIADARVLSDQLAAMAL
jgi:hypothetical protein